MEIEQTIRTHMSEIMNQNLSSDNQSPITHDSVLLDTGLDSLGFAVLVAKLEEKLGYDPFLMMDNPVYPSTFGEFVTIYEKHKDEQ